MNLLRGGPPPGATQTAVVVLVPAAEAVVGSHRRRLDRAACWGVPAHVTVIVPFVPPAEIDDDVLAALQAAVATVGEFECTFATTGRFGDDVLWLAPDPAGPLRRLTTAVWNAFPDHPPYEGAHDDVVPHLTVGERALGGPGALDVAEAAVRSLLPFHQRIDHAVLIAGSDRPDSWRTVARVDLGHA